MWAIRCSDAERTWERELSAQISGLKSWINQNSRNVQSRPNGDGASYVAGYLFQVVVQNNELNVTKCPTIPSIAVSSTKSPELLNNVMDSVYHTSSAWALSLLGLNGKARKYKRAIWFRVSSFR